MATVTENDRLPVRVRSEVKKVSLMVAKTMVWLLEPLARKNPFYHPLAVPKKRANNSLRKKEQSIGVIFSGPVCLPKVSQQPT
jgi:hypothetical protein